MEQQFIKMEEAVKKLGITSERLSQMREHGQLRAYRDGSSWKFRLNEIEQLITTGVPEPSPPSDIGLVSDDELIQAEPITALPDVDDLQTAIDNAATQQYLQHRQKTFEQLTHSGINTIDVSPDKLTVDLINAYLGIKRSGML